MSDKQIIEALIARDEQVTKQFFFESCRPLFVSIINHVFSYKVDYDEFVNEFYLHLMEDDARRLRMFEGRSSIYSWIKIVAIRYFIAKRQRVIDMDGGKSPILQNSDDNDAANKTSAAMDVESLLSHMPSKRYALVIRRLILQEAEPKKVAEELGVTVDNLYNIKKRALASLMQIVRKEH
jgi:RNA polymerase sigma factor (sigma-70 family)